MGIGCRSGRVQEGWLVRGFRGGVPEIGIGVQGRSAGSGWGPGDRWVRGVGMVGRLGPGWVGIGSRVWVGMGYWGG